MWSATLDGGALRFEYAASNNQNFVMRDVQTGTWWQQVSGEALIGPLTGRNLQPAVWDEINFGIWRREHPGGNVLLPDAQYAERYPFVSYRRSEQEQAEGRPLPSWYMADPDVALQPRDMVVSVQANGTTKAYPLALLVAQNPVQDIVGGVPALVVVAPDGRSARAFDRRLEGREMQLYALPDSDPLVLLDSETGSHWDFSGTALSGPLAGSELQRLQTVRDYWFDWRRYHADAPVYSLVSGPAPGGAERQLDP